MAKYNDTSVIKKINSFCNGAIIKMLFTSISFLLLNIVITLNDFNYHVNNLLTMTLIIAFFFFPALSIYKIVCTIIECLYHIVFRKDDFWDEIFNILSSKFGFRKDDSFLERIGCRIPFIGSKIAKQNREEQIDVIKAILSKTFFACLTMMLCYIFFCAIVKPNLIEQATNHSTFSLFAEYILSIINYVIK